MKTYKNLYKALLDKKRIKEIICLSAKGKKKRKEVQKVLDNIDKYIDIIYNMLINKTYYMASTHTKIITERKKQRELTISPFFPNRILDYLIVESLKPIIPTELSVARSSLAATTAGNHALFGGGGGGI